MLTAKKDDRKSVRRPTRRSAEVAIAGIGQPIPCVIFDISNGGARLAIGRSTKDLPDRFTLMLYKDGSAQRECEIVWFDYKYVGVKFVSAWYTADEPGAAERPLGTTQTANTGAQQTADAYSGTEPEASC